MVNRVILEQLILFIRSLEQSYQLHQWGDQVKNKFILIDFVQFC